MDIENYKWLMFNIHVCLPNKIPNKGRTSQLTCTVVGQEAQRDSSQRQKWSHPGGAARSLVLDVLHSWKTTMGLAIWFHMVSWFHDGSCVLNKGQGSKPQSIVIVLLCSSTVLVHCHCRCRCRFCCFCCFCCCCCWILRIHHNLCKKTDLAFHKGNSLIFLLYTSALLSLTFIVCKDPLTFFFLFG